MARRAWLSCGVLLAGVVLLVAAFVQPAGGQSVVSEVKKGGTLRLGVSVDLRVDPALAYAPWEWMLEYATCAKLFNFPDAAGAEGTRVVKEVVDGYSVSRDGKTYTFDLKTTFRFHTGAPVTARSFADAFRRDADPKMQSPATQYLHEIVGADAFIGGRAKTISGVRVLAPYRLQIRLTKPLGDFTARLTMPFFCPLLPNTPIVQAGIDDPAGSGPYYVAERVPNRQIVLKRNPYYRGGRPANVDQIVYTVGGSPEACQVATEQDRVDLCPLSLGLPDAMYRQIVQQYGVNRPGGRFFVTPTLGTWYFAFNHDRPAFKGPGQIPLKKAINYAIDRPALARALGYLTGRRTDQLLPPAFGRDASIYPLRGADPATALKWFKRAKIKPTRLVLYTWNSRFGLAMAQDFAFELKQIGIDVEVKPFDVNALTEKASTRGEPYDIVLYGWGTDYPDGASFFEQLLDTEHLDRPGHVNLSYFDDPKTNATMEAAQRLTGDERRTAWAELDFDLMRKNPPWAPFVHTATRNFVSKSFGCFFFQPVYGMVDLAAACKK